LTHGVAVARVSGSIHRSIFVDLSHQARFCIDSTGRFAPASDRLDPDPGGARTVQRNAPGPPGLR
jgi:hypothetical protein